MLPGPGGIWISHRDKGLILEITDTIRHNTILAPIPAAHYISGARRSYPYAMIVNCRWVEVRISPGPNEYFRCCLAGGVRITAAKPVIFTISEMPLPVFITLV